MADNNNLTEITENFDTIKTLLNSIRAQGILNTSDVDKVLNGINSKLEKINTDEDIDLIKVFLTELKQNLDERYNILLSKFGAIESLFTDLVKNSSEAVKTTDLKEMFDIVATNLSVFSREVVSQKETLSDITMRIDAMRSDESQKKDIIKNISPLKTDLEHLNNGFESIVLSLNENFKLVMKAVSEIDQTSELSDFVKDFDKIANSSNALLSAIQILDQKTSKLEEAVNILATQDDINSAKKLISELSLQNKELSETIGSLYNSSEKLDDLSDKINASVNIIATLKSSLDETEEKNTESVLNKLNDIETAVSAVSLDTNYAELKNSVDEMRKGIASNADILGTKLKTTQSAVADICENSLRSVTDGISALKDAVIKIDESTSTTGNALFETITERLNVFESSLENLISDKNNILAQASSSILERVDSITNLSSVINDKADLTSAAIENAKSDLEFIKSTLKGLTDANIANSLNDIRVELYASKNEFITALENSSSASDKKLAEDFGAGFDNLNTKLLQAENEIKKVQEASLDTIKELLEKISASIIDVLSYVSQRDETNSKMLNEKLSGLELIIKENNIAYHTNIKTSSDLIKSQLAENIQSMQKDNEAQFASVSRVLDSSSLAIQDRLQQSASKIDNLIAVSGDLKNGLEAKISELSSMIVEKASEFKDEFSGSNEEKMQVLKKDLAIMLDSLSGKVAELTEYTSKTSGLDEKVKAVVDNFIGLEDSVNSLSDSVTASVSSTLGKILENFVGLKNWLSKLEEKSTEEAKTNFANLIQEFAVLKSEISASNSGISADFTQKLSILENNFNALAVKLAEIIEKSDNSLVTEINGRLENASLLMNENLSERLETFKSQIEFIFKELIGTSERQSEFVEKHLLELNSSLEELLKNQNTSETERINEIIIQLKKIVDENLKLTASDYSNLKTAVTDLTASLQKENQNFNENFKSKFDDVVKFLNSGLEIQSNAINAQFDDITSKLQHVTGSISENSILAVKQYEELIQKITDNNSEANASLIATSTALKESLKEGLLSQINVINSALETKMLSLSELIEASSHTGNDNLVSQSAIILEEVQKLQEEMNQSLESVKKTVTDGLYNDINSLQAKLESAFSSVSNGLTAEIGNTKQKIADEIAAQGVELKLAFETLNDRLDKDDWSQINIFQEQIKELSATFNTLMDEAKEATSQEVSVLTEKLTSGNKTVLDDIKTSLEEKVNSLLAVSADVSAEELQVIESLVSKIISEIEANRENTSLCKELLTGVIKKELENITQNIEKETDVIVSDLIAQTENIKDAQKDEMIKLSGQIESSVSDYIYSNVSDLRAYLEEKFGDDTVNQKLDGITRVMTETSADVISNINKMLEASVFTSSLSDLKTAVEILVASLAQKLNNQIQEFITENVSENFNNKFELFDKKFVDTLVEKFEDIKKVASDYNEIISNIDFSVKGVSDELIGAKNEITFGFTALKDEIESSTKSISEKLDEFSNRIKDAAAVKDVIAQNTEIITNRLDDLKVSLDNNTVLKDEISKNREFISDRLDDLKVSLDNNTVVKDEISKNREFISDKLDDLKTQIEDVASLKGEISNSTDTLSGSFNELKTHIEKIVSGNDLSDKVTEIENLVNEQLGYITDINDLCSETLPDVLSIKTLVETGVKDSVDTFNKKLDESGTAIEDNINNLKADIITQILNIFNQISFVAEQEEILDFIQEKHSDLITILSHIVTTTEDMEEVRDNLALVDNKIDTVKDEISAISNKISSIISSDGDDGYIYSLQDLESDIANLTILLNDLKKDSKSKEIEELLNSTNDIYKLVETIKQEMPKYELEDFKRDFDSMSEDIMSISTRTNKLILASDESYKALQDNLQDFKLVIDDLDERTRNFAKESGMDRIDAQLGTINTMIQNGAKTNQVFNQVFEYLGEWVDKAGTQIANISDRVETLDDIGQIKVMLEDLKANAENNSNSEELIEALGNIFDKQVKRISSLEAKLDRVIVETTINSKENKIDTAPFENTLNRFLVAIDDKISSQQVKINSLEGKLEEVRSMIDTNDTVQLTKKVGGMDRQIAKLNKSIEKIASHVVEK